MKFNKSLAIIIWIILHFVLNNKGLSQTLTCCEDSICRKEMLSRAIVLGGMVSLFGLDPGEDSLRQKQIEVFRMNDPMTYNRIISMLREVKELDTDTKLCFNIILRSVVSPDIKEWINYLGNNITDGVNKFTCSPEFLRGFGIHVELNEGLSFNNSNRLKEFSFSGKILIAYTFSKHKECGGTIRLLSGGSFFFVDQRLKYFFTTRTEIRIKDFGSKGMVRFGTLKLIAEGNYNNSNYIISVGVGFETVGSGLHFLYGWEKNNTNILQIGLFHRFVKKNN